MWSSVTFLSHIMNEALHEEEFFEKTEDFRLDFLILPLRTTIKSPNIIWCRLLNTKFHRNPLSSFINEIRAPQTPPFAYSMQ